MTPAKLSKLVWQSVNRNRRDFLFSSIGIVIGISIGSGIGIGTGIGMSLSS